MRKREIDRKLDEIIDFSGVERYIDTPVKRYSSGMYVRLAFAVAAHLESEILIVDEVLAVGDAEFQKKCLGKMGEVSKGEGRTVLFVSHNIDSIKELCVKSILLNQGLISSFKNTNDILKEYLSNNFKTTSECKIENIFIGEEFTLNFIEFEPLEKIVIFNFKILNDRIENLRFGIEVFDNFNNRKLVSSYHDDLGDKKSIFYRGEYTIELKLANLFLKNDLYFLKPVITIHNEKMLLDTNRYWEFHYNNSVEINRAYNVSRDSDFILPLEYKIF
jgi:lipopolysaccharide transport system ATP-binding protein